jgi:hypothetical protein
VLRPPPPPPPPPADAAAERFTPSPAQTWSQFCPPFPTAATIPCTAESVRTTASVVRRTHTHASRRTATCIIIAPRRLKFRLSGSARKSQKRFRDTPMIKFRAVLTRYQPFSSGSVRKRATNSNSNAEKWPIIVQFAIRSRHLICFGVGLLLRRSLTAGGSVSNADLILSCRSQLATTTSNRKHSQAITSNHKQTPHTRTGQAPRARSV